MDANSGVRSAPVRPGEDKKSPPPHETHSPYKVSVAFKRACKRAGVEDLRLHDLRHDFATLMLRKTKNLVDVQHALGHKDSRMTLRYAHLLPEDLRSAYEAIDNEGTSVIFSCFLNVEDEKKGAVSVTP